MAYMRKFTLDEYHALDAHGRRPAACGLVGERGIERHLHDAVAIAQIDEHQAAEVAAAVHPSTERDVKPHMLGAQAAARVAAKRRRE